MPSTGTPDSGENSSSDFRFDPSADATPETPHADGHGEGHGERDGDGTHVHDEGAGIASEAARDIADVNAVEIISSASVHLLSAAAVKIGLAEDEATGHYQDLDEARKLIAALAGLVTAAAPEIGNEHARSLRDGLRTLQLAFAEALPYPDAPGQAPGEKWTGRVS